MFKSTLQVWGGIYLEGIVQLGVPRTSSPRHDVPLLAIEGGDIFPNLLHHLQRVDLDLKMNYNHNEVS